MKVELLAAETHPAPPTINIRMFDIADMACMPIVINNITEPVTIIIILFCSPEYFEQETFSVAYLEGKLL